MEPIRPMSNRRRTAVRQIRRWWFWIGPVRLVGGAIVAVALVVAAMWLVRPAPLGSSSAADPAQWLASGDTTITAFELAPLAATPPASPPAVFVHVAGAVVSPGVRRLPGDARVIDAIAAAGGSTAEADLDAVNLAAPIADGQQIYLPRVGEVVAAPPVTAAAGPIDLNTADLETLDRLPGIGPATAAAIIEHRERFGRFSSVDELLGVRGIGPAKLESLRELVVV